MQESRRNASAPLIARHVQAPPTQRARVLTGVVDGKVAISYAHWLVSTLQYVITSYSHPIQTRRLMSLMERLKIGSPFGPPKEAAIRPAFLNFDDWDWQGTEQSRATSTTRIISTPVQFPMATLRWSRCRHRRRQALDQGHSACPARRTAPIRSTLSSALSLLPSSAPFSSP